MKINFKELNDNTVYQKQAIESMKSIISKEEYEDLKTSLGTIRQFNDSMIALYESEEVIVN